MKVSMFVFLALLLASLAQAQDGATAIVFVPNKKGTDQVPIEIVFPLKERTDAHAKMAALRRLIERDLRPEQDGDQYAYLGKCIVEPPYEPQTGKVAFRVECQSFALWRDDTPFVVLGTPGTPEEAMALINQFLVGHRERLNRPVPRPVPTRSRLNRMT